MRDVAKVKNRFELKLDHNQVFFLFAGLAAYSALIFVLGVVVGRSRRPESMQTAMALPETSPTPSPLKIAKVEERLAAAQPKATEEPELPLGFYETLENGTEQDGPKSTPTATAKAVSTATPTATATATATGTGTGTGTGSATGTATGTPTAKPVTTPAKAAATGKFTLQVIAYNDAAQAQKAVAGLKAKGFDAYTIEAQVPGKGTIHRVRVGRFASRGDAETAAGSFTGANPGTKPLVVSYE